MSNDQEFDAVVDLAGAEKILNEQADQVELLTRKTELDATEEVRELMYWVRLRSIETTQKREHNGRRRTSTTPVPEQVTRSDQTTPSRQ